MLAREEAKAVHLGVRFINQHLEPLFVNRTLDAIKGKRRNAAYRGLVLEFVADLRRQATTNSPVAADAPVELPRGNGEPLGPVPHDYPGVLRAAIINHVGVVDWSQLGYEGPRLRNIAERACAGEDIEEALVAWLHLIFPIARRGQPATHSHAVNGSTHRAKPKNRRQARKEEYGRVQALYKRDQRSCCEMILHNKNKAEQGLPVPVGDFQSYWRGLFETPSRPIEDPQPPRAEDLQHHGVWLPFSEEEVSRNTVKKGTAAGPDGISVGQWNAVPAPITTLFYNLILFCGKIPEELTTSRTVFLPKKQRPDDPADYRPISIGSVVLRHLHKLLAYRMQQIPALIDLRQRAFRSGVDGVADNLCVLSTVLREARRRLRPLHLASLDVSKAFDTVSHEAIVDVCRGAGCPPPFVEYIRSLYKESVTILEAGGETCRVRMNRGVRQGDPLSPLLFNLVIDQAVKSISPDVGFDVGGSRVNLLAFADDLVLTASTTLGLQRNLDTVSRELQSYGLLLNPSKSRALSMVPAGRIGKVKVLTDPQFTVDGDPLDQVGVVDVWKYLGIQFEGSRVMGSQVSLLADLEKLTRAPLKPQQRMHLLRTFLLPKHYHGFVLGRVNAGRLRKLDAQVRASVRAWLRLPHTTPLGYFYAPTRSGGLGLPMLRQFIPMLRLRRFTALRESSSEYVRACARTEFVETILDNCRKALREVLVNGQTNTEALQRSWTRMLYSSCDGNPLRESLKTSLSTEWLRSVGRAIPAHDWLHYHSVHINALPSRARMSRGRENWDRQCRAGCMVAETSYHVIQQCFRTHGGRVKRHDALADALSNGLKQKGWSVWKEKSFLTPVGPRKPDLIAVREGRAAIVDVQVVTASTTLDEAHRSKISKYRDVADLSRVLLQNEFAAHNQITSITYATLTISWRGVWSVQSVESLMRLGLTYDQLRPITTRALLGSYLNWCRFNAITTVRRRRGNCR